MASAVATMKLEGRKALVFGGTSGIGLAAAQQLKAGGCREVVAISRDPSKAGDAAAGLTLKSCDTLDRAALAALFKEQGPFDIVVNAATGGERAVGPFLSMDLQGFQGSFAKLWGYTNVVQGCAEYLSDDGCIVLVSGAPARRAKTGQIALSCVGASVEQFTRVVAQELKPKRINVVSPGVIDTPMFGPASEEKNQKLAASTQNNLIPRPGTPDEVASAVMFLVQNDFVTGTTVDVDGGWLHNQ